MKVDVLVAGGGPAGLAAAIELRRLGVGSVLVAEREHEAGGIPRHCAHTGYGLRDLHRVMTGPAYTRHYRQAAIAAGVTLRTGTTLGGWPAASLRPEGGDGTPAGSRAELRATLTSEAGIEEINASAVVLATGCRERPRSARMIPGTRPAGVMTTGELQQRVFLHGERLSGRAVVVGAEHVSFSAMLTLTHAGAQVAAMITDQPRHQSFAAFALAARLRWRAPVWTQTAITGIQGRQSLSAVTLRDDRDGSVRSVPCELLVFTGDWIPDHELARMAGARLDPGTRGPAVDTTLSTSVPGIFAAGNLVHAAETADVAALSGRHAAAEVAAYLAARPLEWPGGRVGVTVADPLAWISPNAVSVSRPVPPREQFVLRAGAFAARARLEVRQDGRLLHVENARLAPARSIALSGRWTCRVDPVGGPVEVTARC